MKLQELIAEIEKCYKIDEKWTEKQVQVWIDMFRNAFRWESKGFHNWPTSGGYDTGMTPSENNNPNF
jgi:hypothetical protein